MGDPISGALIAGALAAYQGAQSHKEAQEQKKLQREANEKQELLAKQEAGKAATATDTEQSVNAMNTQRSGLRRTILSATNKSANVSPTGGSKTLG